jgi:hypothetical protein
MLSCSTNFRLLWNAKFQYRFHKIPALGPTLNQMKPFYTLLNIYEGVSKSYRSESITKYTLTTRNTIWEATQRVMAAKVTRLTRRIAIQLHLVAESYTICGSRSRRPFRKLLDTPSYCNTVHLPTSLEVYRVKLCMHFSLPQCVLHSPLISFLDLITLEACDEKYKLWSCSLCSLPYPPVTSSLLVPNIFIGTLF